MYSGYLGTLEELLVVPIEFKGLLEVKVGGGQRDSEVYPSDIRQDGILRQSMQSHTCVLAQGVFKKHQVNNLYFSSNCP